MSFRFDMIGKSPQQQAIVNQRDRSDEILRRESEKGGMNKENKPIKSTKYCDLWKQVSVEMESGGVAAIELITVKDLKREEVRFAYYKKNTDDTLRLVPRPLDLTQSDLSTLLQKARTAGILN